MTAIIVSVDLVHTGAEPDRAAAFVVLLAFLCSFGFIRTSARLTRSVSWWPGGVETEGGVHLHHLVWGIILLLVSGFVAFATNLESPWWQITAVGFGVGAGFTLDEFALWVRLQDVYWSQEGRASLDAVIMAAVFAALVVIGVQPWGLDESSSILGTGAWVVIMLVLAGLSFMKGRIMLGLVAIFVPIVGLWGAVRLARPSSPWAQRYGEEKLTRAQERFRPDRPGARLGRDFLNLIGGAPSLPDPEPPKRGGDPR
ncbi:MAG: hypothetical protein R2736_00895 [Solirubrobacterales bacterium]